MKNVTQIDNSVDISATFEKFDIWHDHIRINFESNEKMRNIKKLLDCFNKDLIITLTLGIEQKIIKCTLNYLEIDNATQRMSFSICENYEQFDGMFGFIKKEVKINCK